MTRPLTRVNRWGSPMDLATRPSHVGATTPVDVASADDVLGWLCLCEYVAGGFTSPLMRAGRLTGTLFRVRLALLPGLGGGGVLALTFTSSEATERTNLALVHQALEDVVREGGVPAAQWRGAALRLMTRLATSDPPGRRSYWGRPPYDCRLDDPLTWVERHPPQHATHWPALAALACQLSSRRSALKGDGDEFHL